MDLIQKEIFNALGYLLMSGVIFLAWKLAFDNSSSSNYKRILLKGLAWCAGIALFAGLTLGDPSCEQRSDPLYGGCDEYADNGFEATNEQRVGQFSYFLILLYVPVSIGAIMGRKKEKDTKIKIL